MLLSIAIRCETDEKLHMVYYGHKRNNKLTKDRANVKTGDRTKVNQCTYYTLVQFPNTVTGPLITIIRKGPNSESRSRVVNCRSIHVFWSCRSQTSGRRTTIVTLFVVSVRPSMQMLELRISSQSMSAFFGVAPDSLVTSHPFHVTLQLLTESLHKIAHKYPKYDTNNPSAVILLLLTKLSTVGTLLNLLVYRLHPYKMPRLPLAFIHIPILCT